VLVKERIGKMVRIRHGRATVIMFTYESGDLPS